MYSFVAWSLLIRHFHVVAKCALCFNLAFWKNSLEGFELVSKAVLIKINLDLRQKNTWKN
jgi:hypothetical protein